MVIYPCCEKDTAKKRTEKQINKLRFLEKNKKHGVFSENTQAQNFEEKIK